MIRALKTISAFALLFQSISAFAGCEKISLDQGGGTAAHIPHWTQDNLKACFSFTASFLSTVWMREEWSKGQPKFSSFTDDPRNTYFDLIRSPSLNQILDADLGRTCQAAKFIFEQQRIKTADSKNPFFVDPVCEMYGIQKDPSDSQNHLNTPEEFEARMHQLLETNQRPLPFAIEYCSGISTLPGASLIRNRVLRPSLTYLNDSSNSDLNYLCGFHAAVVIGQQERNGKCYFKLRNSNFTEKTQWIPADDLARNTLRVITLRHE